MKIIALSGKKSSGKTTIAYLIKDIILRKNPNADIHIISWADSLKEEVCKACGISHNYLEEHKANFRLILQGWGTDFRRILNGEDYWKNLTFKKLLTLSDEAIVIVPDTRFLNEANAIKKVGGYLWRIVRREVYNLNDTHVSETELDSFKEWDCIIENNASIAELKGTLICKVEQFKIV